MRADETDMKAFCRRLWKGEQGQDLIEYMLLLAFVVMACAGVFFNAGGSSESDLDQVGVRAQQRCWKLIRGRCGHSPTPSFGVTRVLNSKDLWQPNKSK
jgi:Flp pilus assembly pilin Flp